MQRRIASLEIEQRAGNFLNTYQKLYQLVYSRYV